MADQIPELLKLFDDAFDRGDFHTAALRLGEVRALSGNQPDILAAHGHLLLMIGKLKEAEEAAWLSASIEPTHEETHKLLGKIWIESGRHRNGLQQLPGSKYAKYAIPLDYPPSRRLKPRWGYGQPVHTDLAALFHRNREKYAGIVDEMRTLVPSFRKIRTEYKTETAGEAGWTGAAANPLDLALLYYFVWKHRPSTYLEIGSGSTTSIARRAVSDHSIPTRIISIDPEPRSSIDSICDEVVRSGLETMDNFLIFADLKPGDILFMDGSHRCFMNSDVTVFFLEILPLLKPGVIVHIHDIALPYDYPDFFVNWYWSEQYMLAVYLLGMRDRIEVLFPAQYVSSTPGLQDTLKPELLPGAGPAGGWQDGGSFWFTHK